MSNTFFKFFCILGGAYVGSEIAKANGEDPAVGASKWGIGGLLFSTLLSEENDRNTVNYALQKKDKLVYHGITDKERKAKRILEHKYDGKVFDSVVFGSPKTREDAARIEKKRIQRDKPKYNKHHK